MSNRSSAGIDLAAQDALDDLLHGFDLWKDHKISNATTDDMDEMFMRWVEAGPTGAQR